MPFEPRKKLNATKKSVATMWGEVVAAASSGEVVGITDKHGNDVAVMMSKEMYDKMVRELEEYREWLETKGRGTKGRGTRGGRG